jgi:hypothetical protein
MRGRRPPGPEFVQRLQGSAASKQRAEVILKTLTQQLSINDASALLGITPQRLHELRQRSVQAMVDSLEPQPVGRPRLEKTDAAQASAEVARLQQELAATQLRLEIALLLPGRQGARSAKKKGRGGPEKRSQRG